jgi:branched-chain amino acid transport system ATP-binding protein
MSAGDQHDAAPALQLRDVRKTFGATPIVCGVSLDVARGERHAIIGPNGAGKSTLFNLISGRFAPTSGAIRLHGEDIAGFAPYQINRRGLARSFQVTNIFPRLTVFENLRCSVLWSLGYRYSIWRRVDNLADANEQAERTLEQIHMTSRRDALAGVLTYAEQRALEIGITIAGDAEVILLDEPTAGMSRFEADNAVELIRAVTRGKRSSWSSTTWASCSISPIESRCSYTARSLPPTLRSGSVPTRRCKPPIWGASPMLEVADLHAYYGKSHILQGVSLRVGKGEIVSLLGRNGAGRSTTIKAIIGEVPPVGAIHFKGERIDGLRTHDIARRGLGYVPEERAIFPGLTVRQNLLLGVKSGRRPQRWTEDDTFALFPLLRERADAPGGVLSGGEQQMLTICRTLMGDPDLIMIDEPTEGLAPKMVALVRELLERIAARGIAILLIEQKLTIALRICHRLYVMGHGRIVFEGTARELHDDDRVRKAWLEV